VTLSFRLTPRAYADLKNIARFSRQQWDAAQRDKYLRALDERFHWLAKHPYAGRARPDVAAGYYCFAQGVHLIFNFIGADAIEIIGVPHQHMDARNYFDEV
jgi:toxin ParE1/3/4